MTDPSRPQPVVDLAREAAELSTRVSAAIKGLGTLMVVVGITSDADIARWAEVVGIVIVAAGELASYVYTRYQALKAARQAADKVTPLSDPKDHRGYDLVPVDQVERAVEGEHSAAAIMARLEREKRA